MSKKIDEFKKTVWFSRLKEFDNKTDDEEEQDHDVRMFLGWLEQALTQAHQQGELAILNKYAKYLTRGIENTENYSSLEILKNLEVEIERLTK